MIFMLQHFFTGVVGATAVILAFNAWPGDRKLLSIPVAGLFGVACALAAQVISPWMTPAIILAYLLYGVLGWQRAREAEARRRRIVQLHSHPLTPCPFVTTLSVNATGTDAKTLRLVYRLEAEMARLLMPALQPTARADKLWEHSCFEVFLRRVGEPGYVEYNFSPSGEWAAYRFRGYRAPATGQEKLEPPELRIVRSDEHLEMKVTLKLKGVLPPNGQLQLGLAAVIETVAGGLSYWAQKHASDKPDFHHPDSFVFEPTPSRLR
jgi:hypothetical protein